MLKRKQCNLHISPGVVVKFVILLRQKCSKRSFVSIAISQQDIINSLDWYGHALAKRDEGFPET